MQPFGTKACKSCIMQTSTPGCKSTGRTDPPLTFPFQTFRRDGIVIRKHRAPGDCFTGVTAEVQRAAGRRGVKTLVVPERPVTGFLGQKRRTRMPVDASGRGGTMESTSGFRGGWDDHDIGRGSWRSQAGLPGGRFRHLQNVDGSKLCDRLLSSIDMIRGQLSSIVSRGMS